MNITAAIAKLDEIRKEYIPENYIVDRKVLSEVLLALAEPSEDKQFTNKYSDVAIAIRNINGRIGEIENKLGSNNPKKEILTTVGNLEERLSRIEDKMKVLEARTPVDPSASTFIRDAICGHCGHKWNAMFINGVEKDANIECPSCGYFSSSECKPDYKTIYTQGHPEPSTIQISRKVAEGILAMMESEGEEGFYQWANYVNEIRRSLTERKSYEDNK